MNTKKTKKKYKRTTLLPSRSHLLLCLLLLLFSLSLSLSDLMCGLKISFNQQTSSWKNSSKTVCLGCTILSLSSSVLLVVVSLFSFIRKSLLLFPQKRIFYTRIYASQREREFIEIERERECVFISSFSERKEVKSNNNYI